jgi:hypothetical protein
VVIPLAGWAAFPGHRWTQDKAVCELACRPSSKRCDPATFDSISASGDVYAIAHKTAWYAAFSGTSYFSFRRYSSLAPTGLLSGDFDGDDTADGFRATGAVFQAFDPLRSAARTLQSSSAPLAELGVADFDADGVADVVWADVLALR